MLELKIGIDESEIFRKAFELTVNQFCKQINCGSSYYYKCIRGDMKFNGENYISRLVEMYKNLGFNRQQKCLTKLTPNEKDHFLQILDIFEKIYGTF